jgi:hypothetical protein
MLTLNPALLYIYWKYAPIVLAQEEARITLFEDYSGEIVNASKHVGFIWNLSEPGVDELIFEDGIRFPNGTLLLRSN